MRTNKLYSAFSLLALFSLAAGSAMAADTDGDTIDDGQDQFPCDSNLSTTVYVPSQGAFGSVLYEDKWPSKGDLDFNDGVVAYNYALGYEGDSANNNLRMLTLSFNVLAAGAGLPSGLALSLPIPKENVQSVSLQIGSGAPQPLSMRASDGNAVIDLLQNTKDNFQNLGPFVNTDPNLPAQKETQYKLTVRLSSAVQVSPALAPFDLFFFQSGDASHEIHRPSYAGTAGMNNALFQTAQDGSSSSRHFVDKDGLPFVLDLPMVPQWAKERVSVDLAYPQVVGFAASGGTLNTTWYNGPVAPHIYGAGAGGTMPVASFIPGENGYLPGWGDDTCFSCSNGVQDGYEQGVDCGGSCANTCAASCTNGVMDGDEADVDCGGSCANSCASLWCSNGVQDGDEADVDCGGSCANSCESLWCSNGTLGVDQCCSNGVKDYYEQDVDCGGSCANCVCTTTTCRNGVQDANEEGVDCGGGCLNMCVARPGTTCATIHAAQPALGSGVYVIDPDGPGGTEPFQAYCDMATDEGGWTLVWKSTETFAVAALGGVEVSGAYVYDDYGVIINGIPQPGALLSTDQESYGRYSDSVINQIKRSTNPKAVGYRIEQGNCSGTPIPSGIVGYVSAACDFKEVKHGYQNVGWCAAAKKNYTDCDWQENLPYSHPSCIATHQIFCSIGVNDLIALQFNNVANPYWIGDSCLATYANTRVWVR